MPNLSNTFYKKLLRISGEVGMRPEHILNVMEVESGIDPTSHNAKGDASGLVQFMPSTLKGLGFQGSHADFRNMTAEQQLDYVKLWIQGMTQLNGGPLKSAAQYYTGNFLPVALKLPGVKEEKRNTIIVAKNPKKPHLPGVSIQKEKMFYNYNQYLDYNKDGFITYGDIQDVLTRASNSKNYQAALNKLQQSTGYVPQKTKKILKPNVSAPMTSLDKLINKYLRNIAAEKKEYNQLPEHYFTIIVSSNDYTTSIEFARILNSALETELMAKSFTHTDGKNVEVECKINGAVKECKQAINQLSNVLAKVFEERIQKIGFVNLTTEVINKKSSYEEINLKTSESQYRHFLLKLIGT